MGGRVETAQSSPARQLSERVVTLLRQIAPEAGQLRSCDGLPEIP